MQAPNTAQPEKLRGSVDDSELPSSSQMLQAPVGVTASVNDGGISKRKRSDMGNGVDLSIDSGQPLSASVLLAA